MSKYSVQSVDAQTWEKFVLSQQHALFVQSPTYGEFYQSIGEQSWIFGLFEDEKLVGGSLVVSVHARRGNFLYLPYGPLLDPTNTKSVQCFFDHVRKFAKEHSYDFIRISPWWEEGNKPELPGVREAPMHMLAENSWLLDLQQSKDALLAGMKKNHRNLIRRCEREGVTIEIGQSEELLNHLHTMLDATEQRLGFRRFARDYIDNEFRLFAKKGEAALLLSRLPDGTPDAAAIIMFYGSMAVYRHSGSLNTNKKLPTSYLIQWHVMQEAKKRGCTLYNFWGVNPVDEPKHPFAGIGHFKRGFGGYGVDLVPAMDLPITPKYWFNWIVETFRKKKRGF